MKFSQLLTAASLLIALAAIPASAAETGFLTRSIEVDNAEHSYQIYVPENYDSAEQWPVILFLHGAGERGNDGVKQAEVGLGKAIRSNEQQWPGIVVFPQVPSNESWQGVAGDVAMAALDATMEEFNTDASRQYLTGLSLGGNGTWYLGYHHADRFAAMVPICGFVGFGDRFPSFTPASDGDPYSAIAAAIVKVPTWIFHGDADVIVPVEESRKMSAALQSAGAEVHYTELPGVNHNSWDDAYASDEMIEWLFSQRLD